MDKSLDDIIAGRVGASNGTAPGPSAESTGGVSKSGRRGRGGRGKRRGGAAPGGGGSSGALKAVFIRNLHPDISEEDIRNLFREAGPVVRVVIDRGDDGDRTGLAWVVYDYAADAKVAVQRYNQRRAVGRVITLKQVEHAGDTGVRAPLKDRLVGESRRSGRSSRRGRGGASKPPHRGDKSSADLDAELDAYMGVDEPEPAPASTEPAPETASAPAPAPAEAPAPVAAPAPAAEAPAAESAPQNENSTAQPAETDVMIE